jgi:hypothetical protein
MGYFWPFDTRRDPHDRSSQYSQAGVKTPRRTLSMVKPWSGKQGLERRSWAWRCSHTAATNATWAGWAVETRALHPSSLGAASTFVRRGRSGNEPSPRPRDNLCTVALGFNATVATVEVSLALRTERGETPSMRPALAEESLFRSLAWGGTVCSRQISCRAVARHCRKLPANLP